MKKNKRPIITETTLAECILEKVFWCENSNKKANYIILDKKTFKLFKNIAKVFIPLTYALVTTKMFGIKIKVVKSKEQIICVGY